MTRPIRVVSSKVRPADTAEAMEGVTDVFCKSMPASGLSTLARPNVLDTSGARERQEAKGLEPNHNDKVDDNGAQQNVRGR